MALLVACAKPGAPLHSSTAVGAPVSSTPCVLHGTVALDTSARLLIHGAPRIRFRGAQVAIDANVATTPFAVTVRTSPSAPSLRFAGSLSDLPLRTTRALPVVPEHVWIARGAPVRVLPGPRVTTSYTEGIEGLAADASCDALELTRKTATSAVKGTGYHLAHKTFTLFDAPGGRKLIELRPNATNVFTLWVERVDQGFVHVVHRDWITIDGWVRDNELLVGEANDCDDCRGWPMDVEDMCPDDDGETDADGCPEKTRAVAHIANATDVVDNMGTVVGLAEAHTEVFVLERKNGRARIVTPSPPMLPSSGGWWVAESAITP